MDYAQKSDATFDGFIEHQEFTEAFDWPHARVGQPRILEPAPRPEFRHLGEQATRFFRCLPETPRSFQISLFGEINEVLD
jgi:hypothetical protein